MGVQNLDLQFFKCGQQLAGRLASTVKQPAPQQWWCLPWHHHRITWIAWSPLWCCSRLPNSEIFIAPERYMFHSDDERCYKDTANNHKAERTIVLLTFLHTLARCRLLVAQRMPADRQHSWVFLTPRSYMFLVPGLHPALVMWTLLEVCRSQGSLFYFLSPDSLADGIFLAKIL